MNIYEGSRVCYGTMSQRINDGEQVVNSSGTRQKKSSNKSIKQQVAAISGNSTIARILLAITVLVSLIAFGVVSAEASEQVVASNRANQQQAEAAAPDSRSLEAELNSIVQQHESLDGSNKQLAEAIISRFMLDNLTGAGLRGELLDNDIAESDLNGELLISPYNQQQQQQQVATPLVVVSEDASSLSGNTPQDTLRSRKLLSLLQTYGSSLGNSLNNNQAIVPFPELPAGEVATMKRTVNYLQQQQQRHHYGPRNNFDFGLGKRPDSGIKTSILRFGDGSIGGGQVQPVSQFGKRPSAHRYDFGLGKRVASPAYPRYDFGLGKRAPNRIRYDFGLGKK